jgi:hypothetical protein
MPRSAGWRTHRECRRVGLLAARRSDELDGTSVLLSALQGTLRDLSAELAVGREGPVERRRFSKLSLPGCC